MEDSLDQEMDNKRKRLNELLSRTEEAGKELFEELRDLVNQLKGNMTEVRRSDAGPQEVPEKDGVKGKEREDPQDKVLFVGNIPKNVDIDMLRGFLSRFGKMGRVVIKGSNVKSANFAFVTFHSNQVVERLAALEHIYFEGQRYHLGKKSHHNRV